VLELAHRNDSGPAFIDWLALNRPTASATSLVVRISGRPDAATAGKSNSG
jgi:hypothetical protein